MRHRRTGGRHLLGELPLCQVSGLADLAEVAAENLAGKFAGQSRFSKIESGRSLYLFATGMAVHESTLYDAGRSERLLTINDVAERFAISRDTVYRLIRSGEIVPLRVGERLRFRVSDLEDYLERDRDQGP